MKKLRTWCNYRSLSTSETEIEREQTGTSTARKYSKVTSQATLLEKGDLKRFWNFWWNFEWLSQLSLESHDRPWKWTTTTPWKSVMNYLVKRPLKGALWKPDDICETTMNFCHENTVNFRTCSNYSCIVYNVSQLCVLMGEAIAYYYVSLINLVSLSTDGRNWVISFSCCKISFIFYGSRDTVWYHNFDISVRPWIINEIVKSPFHELFNIMASWNWQVRFSWILHSRHFIFFTGTAIDISLQNITV